VSNFYDYGDWDDDAATEEDEELKRGSGDFRRIEPGKVRVRFLPPPPGQRNPWKKVFQHFVKPPGRGEDPIVFPCPKREANRPCPICRHADRLFRTGAQADKDLAFDLYPNMRIFAEVVVRGEEDRGVQILPFGKMIYGKLMKIRRDPDSGGNFTHPLHGFDIIIEREGTGKRDTRYDTRTVMQQSPLGTPEQMELWLDPDERKDLNRFAVPVPVETVERALALATGGEPDPVSSEVVPAGRRLNSARNVTPRAQDQLYRTTAAGLRQYSNGFKRDGLNPSFTTFKNCAILAKGEKSIRVRFDDRDEWVPFSQIGDDSELWEDCEVGEEGDLIVTEWWATKNFLL